MTPPRGVEDAAPYILGREPSANRGGGLPPSLAPLGHNDSRHPVGAGHARPAALRQLPVSFCIPFIFYIVGRGLDPSAASRQIPSMFRPQRENSSPAVHLPPPRSYPQNSQPLPNPTSEGAGLLTFIPYYNREMFTLRPAARRNPVRRCGPSRPLLHCRQRSCRRRCGRCTGPSWPCR